jgi:hypothetical protein
LVCIVKERKNVLQFTELFPLASEQISKFRKALKLSTLHGPVGRRTHGDQQNSAGTSIDLMQFFPGGDLTSADNAPSPLN